MSRTYMNFTEAMEALRLGKGRFLTRSAWGGKRSLLALTDQWNHKRKPENKQLIGVFEWDKMDGISREWVPSGEDREAIDYKVVKAIHETTIRYADAIKNLAAK